MKDVLLITNDNRVYWTKDNERQLHLSQGEYLTDEQILGICSCFLESNRAKALEKKLVITMNSSDEGHELTFEPLTLNFNEMKKIQGELPVELFIRYGRHLVFNDFKALVQRLSEYKKEN